MSFAQYRWKLSTILFTAFLFSTPLSAAQTLIYSDHEPLGNMRTRFINDVFFAAIEKESHGRINIEAHWDSELSSGYDALAMVGEGKKADLAVVVPEYASTALPQHQLFKSFPVGPSGAQQVAFFREVFSRIPAFSDELSRANVSPVFIATGYPLAFFSSKPINNLTDMRGQTWRSASFWHQAFLQNTGARAVTMPWGDATYKALQSGSIDGLMLNVDSGYDLNAQRYAPHVLVSKDLWLGHVYLLVINQARWASLSEEDRAAIQRAANDAYAQLGGVMDRSFDKQIADLKHSGASVRMLKPQEVLAWEDKTQYQQVQSAWVKEQEAKGVVDMKETLEKLVEIKHSFD